MAVYVVSDIHGHLKAFDKALSLASPADTDEIYILGDLIDRGPDPLGVIAHARSLSNAHVLMGNHEELMLLALSRVAPPCNGRIDISRMHKSEFTDWMSWMQNGGATTLEQLEKITEDGYLELLAWMRDLPLYEIVETHERSYILVHAGLGITRANYWRYEYGDNSLTDKETLLSFMEFQEPEDLVWIRGDFWSRHTGLIDEQGEGPVVIAGHTPSPALTYLCGDDVACITDEGKGTIVRLGADESTANVPDRICIDCAAAMGYPNGRIGVLCLDTGESFFADIEEGE